MVNDEFAKDLSKAMEKTSIKTELEPGVTPRRYEPNEGVSNLNKRIHKESAEMDKHGNLPFSFSKPSQNSSKRLITKSCSNCGTHVSVGVNCISMVCSKCNKYASVEEVTIEEG